MGNSRQEKLIVPVAFGNISIGTLEVIIKWDSGWSIGGVKGLAGDVVIVIAILVAGWFGIFILLRRKVFSPLLENTVRLQKLGAISEMAQMFAHDARKPLFYGRMALSSLKVSEPKEAAFLKKATQKVEESSKQIETMLQDMIDYGNTSKISSEGVSINRLCQKILKDLKWEQKSKDIQVEVGLKHEHLLIADSMKIERVLRNIIHNAFEHVPEGGKVWISSNEKKSPMLRLPRISITIGNSGSSVDKKDREKVFTPYYSKRKGGSGLGLAIAKNFTELHNGTLKCSSDKSGTKFCLKLPCVNVDKIDSDLALEQRDADNSLSRGIIRFDTSKLPPKEGRLKILVIDDELFYRQAINKLIGKVTDDERIDIMEADSANQALTLARSEKPNIAIVDYKLGNESEDGLYLLERLRALIPDIRLCFHTSYLDDSLKKVAIVAGANIAIQKPLNESAMAGLLIDSNAFCAK